MSATGLDSSTRPSRPQTSGWMKSWRKWAPTEVSHGTYSVSSYEPCGIAFRSLLPPTWDRSSRSSSGALTTISGRFRDGFYESRSLRHCLRSARSASDHTLPLLRSASPAGGFLRIRNM
jgi:hypothetical protein